MRFLTLLPLVLCLISPVFSATEPERTQRVVIVQARGDLNFDGRLDIADFIILVHYLNGGPPGPNSSLEAMDVNRDDHINIADLMLLSHMIFGSGSTEGGDEERTVPAPPTETFHVTFGDINGDFRVDDEDLRLLTAYLDNPRSRVRCPLDACDVNRDGRIDPRDREELSRRVRDVEAGL